MTASREPSLFSIRRVTADDYERLVSLWTLSGMHPETQGRESKSAFLQQLEQFPDLYLAATVGERIVGVVLGTHDGRKGWINRLAVHPDHQRRGIASALVTACDKVIRARGIGIVAALVDDSPKAREPWGERTARNAASAALFEALGYREDVPVRYFRKLGGPSA